MKYKITKQKNIILFELMEIKDKIERVIIYNKLILKNLKNLTSGRTIIIINELKNGGLMVGLNKNLNRDKEFILKNNLNYNINFYKKEKLENNFYNVLLNINSK